MCVSLAPMPMYITVLPISIEYLSVFFTMGLNERLVYEDDLKGSDLS